MPTPRADHVETGLQGRAEVIDDVASQLAGKGKVTERRRDYQRAHLWFTALESLFQKPEHGFPIRRLGGLRTKEATASCVTCPPSGNPRAQAGQGLKSIFRLLKARKVLFADPTVRVPTGRHQDQQPLPVDLDDLRDALNASNPAHAAVAAQVAFHALGPSQVQRLRLTDVRDRTLHIDGRSIPLGEPVRHALTAYLNHRQTRWPHTSNPYLFVTIRSASSDAPVSRRWVWQALGPKLSTASIRQDCILDEAHATGGDVRRAR